MTKTQQKPNMAWVGVEMGVKGRQVVDASFSSSWRSSHKICGCLDMFLIAEEVKGDD